MYSFKKHIVQAPTLQTHSYIYIRQGGYVFARVCLSVCLCVSKITQKVMRGCLNLSEIFRECREWQNCK